VSSPRLAFRLDTGGEVEEDLGEVEGGRVIIYLNMTDLYERTHTILYWVKG